MFEECLLQILAFLIFLPETLPAPNIVLTRTQWLGKWILVSVDKTYKSKQFEDIWLTEKNVELNTGFLIPSSSWGIGLGCDCREHWTTRLHKAGAELFLIARGMDHHSNPVCFSALLHEGSNKTSIIFNSLLTDKKAKLNILSFKYGAVDCNYKHIHVYTHWLPQSTYVRSFRNCFSPLNSEI